jgi:ubiquinone/menaquinone biosynthesis C-methylase UbiE
VCDYLKKNKEAIFPPDPKVLLFAPGFCISNWFKQAGIKCISADLLDTALVKIDIQAIAFGDDELDYISCDQILEHVPDYMLALKELYRVAKPGGCVAITVPLMPEWPVTYEDESVVTEEERKEKFGQTDHLRIFGMDFEQKLRASGFDLTIYDGDMCDARIVPIVGGCIYDYNKVFICKKPLALHPTW